MRRRVVWLAALGVAALALAAGWIAPPPPQVPAFDAVRAGYRPSDLALLDRHGEVIHEVRVDPTRRRLAWTQEVAGTPFERILKSAAVEIEVEPDPGGSRVSLGVDEALRGISRLGSPMMRMATRRRLDEALDGIERAVGAQ